MGYRFSTASTAIPKHATPDWEAARHAIDTVQLETLWGTGEKLYPWELWLEDFGRPPDPYAVYFGIHSARESLENDVALIRETFGAGPGPHLLLVETPEHLVYVTGGETVGEDPTPLWSPLAVVGETGALDAAGFAHRERFASTPIGERTDGLRGVGRVRAAAARALLSIVDDVEAMADRDDRPDPLESPDWWAERIERRLRVAEVRLSAVALIDLTTDLLDLARRVHPGGPSMAILGGLDGLMGSTDRPLSGLRDVRCHAHRLRSRWKQVVREMFAVENEAAWLIAEQLVSAALLSLGAARPNGIADLRNPRDRRPWPTVVPAAGDGLLDDAVEWWMLPAGASIDWNAALAAARGDEHLTTSVERVRAGVEAGDHRLVETVELPDATVWITGGTHRPEWDVVTYARRARKAGLLDVAGLTVRSRAERASQPAWTMTSTSIGVRDDSGNTARRGP